MTFEYRYSRKADVVRRRASDGCTIGLCGGGMRIPGLMSTMMALSLVGCARTSTQELDASADVHLADDGAGPNPDATIYCWISGPHTEPADAGGWWICAPSERCCRHNQGGWNCRSPSSSDCLER